MVSIRQNIVSLFASSFVITLLQCPIYVYNDVDWGLVTVWN